MRILSFDIEYNPSTKKITQVGFCDNHGNTFRGSQHVTLLEALAASDLLIGHNILHHDLKVLRERYIVGTDDKMCIDTLFLSVLLFPNKPYHRLVKKYFDRLSLDRIPNPALDSKIVLEELLPDLQEKWEQTSPTFQNICFHLLQKHPAFSGFFQLMHFQQNGTLEKAFSSLDPHLFCRNKDLNHFVKAYPVELAYALAIIHADNDESVLPPWLIYTFPNIIDIIARLRSEDCRNPQCQYCQTHLSAVTGLKKHFGFPGYRTFSENEEIPLQQSIVEAGLRKDSLLAVLPTGGGKSLCYQVPALMGHEMKRSLTVVISPLQSLMKDQVDNLAGKNILKAFTINGMVDPITRQEAVHAVENGKAAMLYISPESLRSNTIFNLLLKRDIERFVIDEAHCFSAWGHDFRPDYMYIARFISKVQNRQIWNRAIPVSCFTATAKPQVVEDINRYFHKRLGRTLETYTTDAKRTNLAFKVSPSIPDDKFDRLLELLDALPGPTIIYTSRVKRCEEIATKLQQYQFKALAYHGQLDARVKKARQEAFMAGTADIIVATSAFGMGVDKSDVRHVIHYEISNSLENYIQEAGRAGRDAKVAECHVLFNEEDLQKHFNLLNSTKLNKKDIDQVWRAIKLFKNERFSKSALEIAEKAGWDLEMFQLETRVKTAIAALEEEKFVQREENATRIYAKNILVKNFDQARKIIQEKMRSQDEKEIQTPIRIMQHLMSRDSTQVDEVAYHLGLERVLVGNWINTFKDWKLVGDTVELEAEISIVKSKNSSRKRLERCLQIENKLITYFENAPAETYKIYLKQLHDDLEIEQEDAASFYTLARIINFWDFNRKIRKKPLESGHYWMKIQFNDKEKNLASLCKRNGLAPKLLEVLHKYFLEEQAETTSPIAKARFTVTGLQQKLCEAHKCKISTSEIEEALFFMILMEVITIDGGLIVFYNPMRITRLKETKERFTKNDFKQLKRFYDSKTEQIHIVGEYAKKMLRSNLEAMQFVDDYFQLNYTVFLEKYFKNVKGKIKRPVTEKNFRKIFGALSTDQFKIINDRSSKRILVGAGPGSGKTRVLVHKVASIIMLEDVKPDQFLMLTFSRPAAMEMRKRLKELIGEVYGIDIMTFHAYAFDLIGKRGDLEKSGKIIPEATLELRAGEQLFPRVGKKEVILIDEFQDVDQEQYDMLNAIIRLAGDVRVIAVGDDDQNIYAFRGSSIEFMAAFARTHDCKKYYLTKNYRSKINLVEFSNTFLERMPGPRLKKGEILSAHDQRKGILFLHTYPENAQPIRDLIANVLELQDRHSVSILTRTNEEALQVHAQLVEHKVPVTLILSREGYRIREILEIQSFTHWLQQVAEEHTGRVKEEDFARCVQNLKKHYANSGALEFVLHIIEMFKKGRKHFFKSDWLSFIQELRHDDVVPDARGKIRISTMHKAKGKEFDAVYLYLDNYTFHAPEHYRLLYVAMSRARNSLKIFSNSRHLVPLADQHGTHIPHQEMFSSPEEIILLLQLKHIYLDKVKRRRFQDAVKPKLADDILEYDHKLDKILVDKIEVILSEKGKTKINKWKQKGYLIVSVCIDMIVLWRDQKEEYKHAYRIPLPRVVMRKRG